MKNFIVLLILLFSVFTIAQNSDFKKIDAILASQIEETDPGLFVGIVKDGNIIYENYRGLSNLQHQVKVNKQTRSNIASVAKQFTALMILQLSLEDKLSLEDDIRIHLPKLYPNVKEKIKIRHLLNHTSGIRDYADLMSIQRKPWWRQEGLNNDDVIDLLEKQEELAFSPGSRYMYSNSGYTLLTKIIALASGKAFHEYSKNFFQEIGMKNTAFLKNYMHIIPNQALPYSDWGDGVWQQYPMMTNLYGDGFLFTTLEDQLLFEQAVQNAKHNNNILLIESQKTIPNSEIITYGFGLELEDRLNNKAIHHSGGTGSYHAQVVRYPDENLTVFVMSTNSRIWSGSIADKVASVFLPKKKSEDKYDDRINENVASFNNEKIIGQYISPGEYLIRIIEEEGKLYWRNGNNNPIEINKERDNIYSIKRNPKMKVGFYDNELVYFYPSGKTNIYKKIPIEKPSLSDLESYEGVYFSRELNVTFSLELTETKKLMISRSDWKKAHEVEILNRNELLVFDYILKIQRDQFNRVIDILLTTNRVINNRFIKKSNLKYQPKIATNNGSIQVTTIGSKNKGSQILLTKNYANGNEIWSQQFGGKSYDKASSIMDIEDGYLIIGSTSSFGKGNYDIILIKTDKNGKKLWQSTYGKLGNEYGYSIEKTSTGYIVKGTIQKCTSNSDVFNRKCTTNVWFVTTDKNGNERSNMVLEEIE